MVDGVAYEGVRYRLRCTPAGALTVLLEHPLAGRSFERVLADGAAVPAEHCGTPGCPHVRIGVWLSGAREVQFVGRPAASGPAPGA